MPMCFHELKMVYPIIMSNWNSVFRKVLHPLAKKGSFWWMGVKLKKADIEYPFEHGEVINYTLDGVAIQSLQIYRHIS